jgi:hypothetical protein
MLVLWIEGRWSRYRIIFLSSSIVQTVGGWRSMMRFENHNGKYYFWLKILFLLPALI